MPVAMLRYSYVTLRYVTLRCILTSKGASVGRGVGWFATMHLKKLSMHASFLQASLPASLQQTFPLRTQGFYEKKNVFI